MPPIESEETEKADDTEPEHPAVTEWLEDDEPSFQRFKPRRGRSRGRDDE